MNLFIPKFPVSSNLLTKSAGNPSRGPYAFGSNQQWVGYDDIDTVKAKSQLILDAGYGGAAIWTLDLDDFNNLCCQGANPLLNAASQVLRGRLK
jgi:chitinase